MYHYSCYVSWLPTIIYVCPDMSPLRCFPWLLISLYAAAVFAGTKWLSHAHRQIIYTHSNYSHKFCFYAFFDITHANESVISSTDHPHFASATGVGGAKVDNMSEICRYPCEDLVDLLTEIHGLRIVTNNLLEDLERVVRYINAFICHMQCGMCLMCLTV